eukprot:scaffold111081_cov17-Tisochrysis_lutea.AAC.1
MKITLPDSEPVQKLRSFSKQSLVCTLWRTRLKDHIREEEKLSCTHERPPPTLVLGNPLIETMALLCLFERHGCHQPPICLLKEGRPCSCLSVSAKSNEDVVKGMKERREREQSQGPAGMHPCPLFAWRCAPTLPNR